MQNGTCHVTYCCSRGETSQSGSSRSPCMQLNASMKRRRRGAIWLSGAVR